jgi:hypothetical protein
MQADAEHQENYAKLCKFGGKIAVGYKTGGKRADQNSAKKVPGYWRNEPPRDCRRPFGLNYAAIGVSSSMA